MHSRVPETVWPGYGPQKLRLPLAAGLADDRDPVGLELFDRPSAVPL
jgi:hypothetical protein